MVFCSKSKKNSVESIEKVVKHFKSIPHSSDECGAKPVIVYTRRAVVITFIFVKTQMCLN